MLRLRSLPCRVVHSRFCSSTDVPASAPRLTASLHDAVAAPTETPTAKRANAADTAASYKTNRKPARDIKVRRRAPWGAHQLRDSWSNDAMTRRDRENMSERIHREYRYHPDEQRRFHIKWAAFAVVPAVLTGLFAGYYRHTGRPLWEGDPQYILNLVRQMDMSPRSKLHPYRLEGTEELPAHVQAYREKHMGRRAEAHALSQA